MRDLGDHTAHGRRIFERACAIDFSEAEAVQRRALILGTADRAFDLRDRHRAAGFFCLSHGPYSLAYSAELSPRRETISPTFLPRRAATVRGDTVRFSA